jgi:hypothetical protein
MISPWIAPVILFSVLLVITVILRERDRRRNADKKIAKTSK